MKSTMLKSTILKSTAIKNVYRKTLAYGALVVVTIGINNTSVAELVSLDDASLQKTVAQNGVLIDADVRFNRSKNADDTIGDSITCSAKASDCEIGMRLEGTPSWLVMYDVSGGVNIKNLKLSASKVSNTSGTEKPAIEIGDTSGTQDTTIEFDHFGASSIAFTKDDGATPGYRAAVPTGNSGLDNGVPKGIYGVRLNGTLTMTGGIKIFNCSGMGIAGC